jgi:hypothetical protein
VSNKAVIFSPRPEWRRIISAGKASWQEPHFRA